MLLIRTFVLKYRKQLIITLAILLLNLAFGFDPRFTIINLIWLLV